MYFLLVCLMVHLINGLSIHVTGIAEDKLKITRFEQYAQEFVYNYTEGETIHWHCSKVNPSTDGLVHWDLDCQSGCPKTIKRKLTKEDNGEKLLCIKEFSDEFGRPRYAYITIVLELTVSVMTPRNTQRAPSESKYQFYFSGLDVTRYFATTNNNFIYRYNDQEELKLKCTALDMTVTNGNLKSLMWDYRSGIQVFNVTCGTESTLNVTLVENNNNQKIVCKDKNTGAKGTIILEFNNESVTTTTQSMLSPSTTCDNNPKIEVPTYGCLVNPDKVNKPFFITGLPKDSNPTFTGDTTCTTTVQYSAPFHLKLRCYRYAKKFNIVSHQIRWRFGNTIVASKPFDGCKGSVEHTFIINEDNDKQTIVCEYDQFRITLLLKYIETPTTTVSVIPLDNDEFVADFVNSPFVKTRMKRAYNTRSTSEKTNKDAERPVKEIEFELYLKNKSVYTCDVNQNVTVMSGDVVTVKVHSKRHINHFWCFPERNNSNNIINNIVDVSDDGEKIFVKNVIVNKSLQGVWNCTFLGYRKDNFNWTTKYTYDNMSYLRANCSINVTVIESPITTQTPTTTNVVTKTTAKPTITTRITHASALTYSEDIDKEIKFKMKIEKNKYKCDVTPKNVVLMEGKETKIVVTSQKYVNYFWCFSEKEPKNNILKNFNTVPKTGFDYIKQINVTRSMEGAWDCTFLGTPIRGNRIDYYPRRTQYGVPYLWAGCSLNVTVKPNPKATTTMSTTVSTTTTASTPMTTSSMTSTTMNTETSINPTTIDSGAVSRKDSPSNSSDTSAVNGSPTGTGNFMMTVYYGLSGVICFIILIVLICVLHRHIKRNKKIKKTTTDVTYENLSNDSNRQFPPNLEALYAKPYDSQTNEESPYAVSPYQETDTYSVPYVESDVNKLYAKPLSKKERKDKLYTKVLPKTQRKQKKELVYAEIETGASKSLVKKPEATYSEIMPGNYNTGYENVFNSKERYANAKESEYAEPAYCELNRNNRK